MVGWDEGFPLPTDPGPIHKCVLRVWYRIEDWWRGLDPVDRTVIKFLVLGVALWILVARG